MTPDITAVCSLIRIMIEIKSHTGLSVCWAPASSDNYVTKHVSGSCLQECGWQPGWLPCLEDREHAGGPHSKWGMGQILFWRCLHHPLLSSFWNKALNVDIFAILIDIFVVVVWMSSLVFIMEDLSNTYTSGLEKRLPLMRFHLHSSLL